jgi:hypothetical protein
MRRKFYLLYDKENEDHSYVGDIIKYLQEGSKDIHPSN